MKKVDEMPSKRGPEAVEARLAHAEPSFEPSLGFEASSFQSPATEDETSVMSPALTGRFRVRALKHYKHSLNWSKWLHLQAILSQDLGRSP